METNTTKPAEKPAVASSGGFGVGDEVSWMHYIGTRGTSMGFKTRRGKIYAISSGMAYVKLRNGRQVHVLVSALDEKGVKTRLSQLVDELAEGKTPNSQSSATGDTTKNV